MTSAEDIELIRIRVIIVKMFECFLQRHALFSSDFTSDGEEFHRRFFKILE